MLDTSTRLLHLLTVLQSRRFWTGGALAEHLEVTSRTLRRDVERLRSLGYVIDATSGPGGGYQLGTGRTLPPLLLDDDEAIAVAVSMRASVDTMAGFGETAMRALVKLEQLLPARLQKRVSALFSTTMSLGAPDAALRADTLVALAAACRDERVLRFDYEKRGGERGERTVEPMRLVHRQGRRWYLVAYDRDRNDLRTFRVDRVLGAPRVGEGFVPRRGPDDLERYVSESLSSAPYALNVRARLHAAMHTVVRRVPPWVGVLTEETETTCILESGADHPDALVVQLVLTGVEFEILDSPALVAHTEAVARRLLRSCGEG